MAWLFIFTTENRVRLLSDTLSSIEPHLSLLDSIFISFNGASPSRHREDFESLVSSFDADIHLNFTDSFLPPIKHSFQAIRKIRPLISPSEFVLLLADDDLLPSENFLGQYIAATSENEGLCLGFGNFSCFESDLLNLNSPLMHIEPGEFIDPLEFLRRNQVGHRFTNMSSMLVPFSVLDAVLSFMHKYRSSGRRFEYMLATSAKIKALYSPPNCSVLIRKHPMQEGRNLSITSMFYDEIVYIFWVWKNRPELRPWVLISGIKGFSFLRVLKLALRFVFGSFVDVVLLTRHR